MGGHGLLFKSPAPAQTETSVTPKLNRTSASWRAGSPGFRRAERKLSCVDPSGHGDSILARASSGRRCQFSKSTSVKVFI